MNFKSKAEANSLNQWQQIKIGDFANCPLTIAFMEAKHYKVKITDDGVTMFFFRALRLKAEREEIGKVDIIKLRKIIRPFGMFLNIGDEDEPDELFTERHPSEIKEAIRDFKEGLDALWDIEWRLNKEALNK